MANVTYLIGAGASAGKYSDNGHKDEGLPIVSEIQDSILGIILFIQKTEIPITLNLRKPQLGLNSVDDWKKMREILLARFEDLHAKCRENATIDTYAKKLILKGEIGSFKNLEQMLTLFFIWEQLIERPDSRYDTFLANILGRNLRFPDYIRVISWNYDSQFEIAYHEYNPNNTLSVGSKRTNHKIPHDITKINGTATFTNQDYFPKFRKDFQAEIDATEGDDLYNSAQVKDQKKLIKLICLYKSYIVDSEDNTDLSFAFDETSTPSQAILDSINEIIKKTDVLVIIGYTFPFFNRQIDRQILENLKPNAKIYIQDKYPKSVRQSLEAVLTDVQRQVQIVEIERTEQFYLPPEL